MTESWRPIAYVGIGGVACAIAGILIWGYSPSYSSLARIDQIEWQTVLIYEKKDCITKWRTDGEGRRYSRESCSWNEIDRISRAGFFPDSPQWPRQPNDWYTRFSSRRIERKEYYTAHLSLLKPRAGEQIRRYKKFTYLSDYNRLVAIKDCQVVAEINRFGGVNTIEKFSCP